MHGNHPQTILVSLFGDREWPHTTHTQNLDHTLDPEGGLDDLVAIARGQTPDPIPNSAVKTLSANGTAS